MLQTRFAQLPGQGVQSGRVAVVDGAGPGIHMLTIDPFQLSPQPTRSGRQLHIPTDRIRVPEDPGAAV